MAVVFATVASSAAFLKGTKQRKDRSVKVIYFVMNQEMSDSYDFYRFLLIDLIMNLLKNR